MAEKIKCIFCDSEDAKTEKGRDLIHHVSCPICGQYRISKDDYDDLPSEGKLMREKIKVSSYIREANLKGVDPKITMKCDYAEQNGSAICIQHIANRYPEMINDKITRIIMNLGKRSHYTGETINLIENDYPLFYPLQNKTTEVEYTLKYLHENGYIDTPLLPGNPFPEIPILPLDIVLTPKAIEFIQNSNINEIDSKDVFIAMNFDDKLKCVYENSIRKAIEECKYEPIREDYEEFNEKICDKILVDIKKARFVIAEFTGQKHGVYFEAGYALGLGKPVIWICRNDDIENVHFDTRQYNHIVWESGKDLYEKLVNRIIALFGEYAEGN